MEFLFIYIASVVIGCIIGSAKGRLSSGLVWSLLFGPLGVVIVLFLPRIAKQKKEMSQGSTSYAASGQFAQDSLAGVGNWLKRIIADPPPVDSSYNQEQMPDGRTRFTVTPASVQDAPTAKGCAGGYSLMIGIFGLAVMGASIPDRGTIDKPLLVLLGIIALIAVLVTFRLTSRSVSKKFAKKINKLRSPGGTFIVSSDGIELPNREIVSSDRLHRLILRNGVPEENQAMFVATSYLAGSLRNYQASAGAANRAIAEKISYMLCAEHGGKSTCLAGGMTETTAYGLMQDVGRILKLKG